MQLALSKLSQKAHMDLVKENLQYKNIEIRKILFNTELKLEVIPMAS